mgnify:CR=1 FL=1
MESEEEHHPVEESDLTQYQKSLCQADKQHHQMNESSSINLLAAVPTGANMAAEAQNDSLSLSKTQILLYAGSIQLQDNNSYL